MNFLSEEKYKASDKERLAWLRLIRSENIGVKTFDDLLRLYGSAETALENVSNLSIRGGRQEPVRLFSAAEAEEELERLEKISATLITRNDAAYPKRLLDADDSPPVITVLGDTALLNRESVALVGARNASANAWNFTFKMAKDLAESGMVVISGLARGIDTAAHKGSLQSTIAVLAGGIDNIYPPENRELYKKIAEQGAIIAEMPLGAVPKAQHFPRRNRIISGISLGTVVVEAAKRSGSLITARLATEQGREVMAVPGFPLDPRSEGTNKLLKEGAALVENAEDVMNAVRFHGRLAPQKTFFEEEAGFIDLSPPALESAGLKGDDLRKNIYENLSSSPISIDNLVVKTSAETASVLVALLELEIAGKLLRHPGNKVSLLIA